MKIEIGKRLAATITKKIAADNDAHKRKSERRERAHKRFGKTYSKVCRGFFRALSKATTISIGAGPSTTKAIAERAQRDLRDLEVAAAAGGELARQELALLAQLAGAFSEAHPAKNPPKSN